MRSRAHRQREQPGHQRDAGEVAVEGADQHHDVERRDEPGEHGEGDDRRPAQARRQRPPEEGQQRAEDEAGDQRADDGEQGRQAAAIAGGQRAQILHSRGRAARRRDTREGTGDRLRRRHAERLGGEDAIGSRPGDEDAVDVGVQQCGARLRLRVVAAHVERVGGRGVERGLQPRRLHARPDHADVIALRARGMERGDVQRREREDHREAAEHDPCDGQARPGGWRVHGSGSSFGSSSQTTDARSAASASHRRDRRCGA